MKRKIDIDIPIVHRYNINEGIKCSNFDNGNENIINIDNWSNNSSDTEIEFLRNQV